MNEIERLARRKTGIVEELERREATAPVAVGLREVLAVLEAMDRGAAIERYRNELRESIEFLAGSAERPIAALVFGWFFDGGELENVWADGTDHGSCVYTGQPGGTDLFEAENLVGIEPEPEFDDRGDGASNLFVSQVMGAWYESLYPRCRDAEVNQEVQDGYEDLFQITLYEAVHEAARAVAQEPVFASMPRGDRFHLFLRRRDRWPVPVFALG